VGASWAGFDTTLTFPESGERVELRQHAATLSLTRVLERGWSLRVAAGGTLGGSVGPVLESGPGAQAAVQGAKLWRQADGARPFVSSSLALAAGWTKLDDRDLESFSSGSLVAADLRLGTAVGWEVAGFWSPYLSAQLFGGPAFLTVDAAQSQGTDVHKYRLSAGSSLFIGDAITAFVDVAPLGERGIAAGLSYAL